MIFQIQLSHHEESVLVRFTGVCGELQPVDREREICFTADVSYMLSSGIFKTPSLHHFFFFLFFLFFFLDPNPAATLTIRWKSACCWWQRWWRQFRKWPRGTSKSCFRSDRSWTGGPCSWPQTPTLVGCTTPGKRQSWWGWAQRCGRRSAGVKQGKKRKEEKKKKKRKKGRSQ